MIISGTMIGNIQAREEVRLEKNGKLLGDVESPVLHLTPGVLLKGHMTITGGQKKDIEKIIDESFGESITKTESKEQEKKK